MSGTMLVNAAGSLAGEVAVPGDKSISHRAIMLGAIARGQTRVENVLECDDCAVTEAAFRAMGVAIRHEGSATVITGSGLRGLAKPAGPLWAGESGTTMRILPGILAGQPFEATLEAAPSLARRPMGRVVEPLASMGVAIRSRGGYPPLDVRGGAVKPVAHRMGVPSAQVKSAILFAGLYADGRTTVEESGVSRDHTERMMAHFGAALTVDGARVTVEGGRELCARSFTVPGDISSAAFFMVGAAIVPGSRVRIPKVSVNPTRSGIIDAMAAMGSSVRAVQRVDAFEPYADIEVAYAPTHGITIEAKNIPRLIDELPVLAVLAAVSRGTTVIEGAEELRVKETDRIRSMQENIRAMGGICEVDGGRITIEGVPALAGGSVKSYGDHRTCMAMAVAALAAKAATVIDETGCVSKSFPGFFDALGQLIRA